MSYSFELDNVLNLAVSSVVAELTFNDLAFVAGYPAPQSDRWPQGFTYVHRHQISARSVEVDYDGEMFQVRIFTASSPEDIAFAIDLVRAVAKVSNATITTEGEGDLSLAEFEQHFDQGWIADHAHGELGAAFTLFAKSLDRHHKVSGVNGTLTIGPKVYGQIMAEADDISTAFFSRLKKLNTLDDEDIYQSPLTVIYDPKTNKNVRLATYGQDIEAVLVDRNTLVAIHTEQSELIYVPLTQFPTLLPNQAKWISEDRLWVPALAEAQWHQFTEAAQKVAITDLGEYGYDPKNDPFADLDDPNNANMGPLTQAEKDTLVYAPMAVFCFVAGADGKIDSKEIKALQTELAKGVLTDSTILQAVLVEAIADFKHLITELLSDEVDVESTLIDIVNLLDSRISPEESRRFKTSLLTMGQAVAEASGGFLGLYGNKVCKAEKQALARLRELFGFGR